MRRQQSRLASLPVRVAALVLLMAVAWALGGCEPAGKDKMSYSQAAPEAQFEAAVDRPPTPESLYAMARILAAQGKDKQCRYVLIRTITQYPKFMPAYCEMAELQVRRGEVDRAIGTLNIGLKFSPRDPVLVNNLGMCNLLKCDYEAAIENFTQAAGAAPHDARYRANMALALGMVGRYRESMSLFRQVLPEAEARHNLRVICKAVEDRERAAREAKTSATALVPAKAPSPNVAVGPVERRE